MRGTSPQKVLGGVFVPEKCPLSVGQFSESVFKPQRLNRCSHADHAQRLDGTPSDGWSYDAAGNTLNDGEHAYTYDANNMVTGVDGGAVQYKYDAAGRSVGKVTAAETVHYAFGSEYSTVSGWRRVFVAVGGVTVEYRANQTYFHQSDHLGTPRVQTDSAGSLVETWSHYPFGEQWEQSGSGGNEHRFTGHRRDGETGNDYAGARFLKSSRGRWLSADPVLGDARSPQRLNRYSYALNLPSVLVDGNGADPEEGEEGGASAGGCTSAESQGTACFTAEVNEELPKCKFKSRGPSPRLGSFLEELWETTFGQNFQGPITGRQERAGLPTPPRRPWPGKRFFGFPSEYAGLVDALWAGIAEAIAMLEHLDAVQDRGPENSGQLSLRECLRRVLTGGTTVGNPVEGVSGGWPVQFYWRPGSQHGASVDREGGAYRENGGSIIIGPNDWRNDAHGWYVQNPTLGRMSPGEVIFHEVFHLCGIGQETHGSMFGNPWIDRQIQRIRDAGN